MVTQQDVVDYIKSMSALELSKLVKTLEKELGVKAIVPMPQPETVVTKEETELKTVVLMTIGKKKIEVIKVVRQITNLGLQEAKEFVERAPEIIKEGVHKLEAEILEKKFAAVGATVKFR